MKAHKKLCYSMLAMFLTINLIKASNPLSETLPFNEHTASIRVKLNPNSSQYHVIFNCLDPQKSSQSIAMHWNKTNIANKWLVSFSGTDEGTQVRYGKDRMSLQYMEGLLVTFASNGVMKYQNQPFNPVVEFTWAKPKSRTYMNLEFINPIYPTDACKITEGNYYFESVLLRNQPTFLDKIN